MNLDRIRQHRELAQTATTEHNWEALVRLAQAFERTLAQRKENARDMHWFSPVPSR